MKTSAGKVSAAHPLSTQVTAQRYFFQHAADARASGIVYGGWEACAADYAVARDGFAFSVVEFVASGNGTVSLDGVSSPLRPGSLFTYGRHTRVRLQSSPTAPMTKYFLCFAGPVALGRLRRAGLPPRRPAELSQVGEVQEAFDGLIREGQRHRSHTAPICAALAEVLLLKLEELLPLQRRAPVAGAVGAEALFIRCRQLIDRDAARLRTLEQIAVLCGASPAQLCRVFQRHQGISPYRYLMRRKMHLAAELMRETGCLAKEAGERVGFPDPYHFSRRFKAVLGLGPRAYLRAREPSGRDRAAHPTSRSRHPS